MLNFVERSAKLASQSFFAIAREHPIKGGLDGGSKGTVISCPEFADAAIASFLGHVEDFVRLFEVEGEADSVPAAAKLCGEFRSSWVLENGNSGNILAKEAQAEGNTARHTKAPTKVARAFSR